MPGLHLTADLHGSHPDNPAMTDAAALEALCTGAVSRAGLQPVGRLFHSFAVAGSSAPAGVTGVVLLSESHLAVHTWPEFGAVTLDVYVCNVGVDNSAAAQRLMEALCTAFGAERIERQSLRRGPLAAAPRAADAAVPQP